MIRASFLVVLFTASLVASNVFAQGHPPNDRWCLQAEGSTHCNFQTLSQCQAARHGGSHHCVRNF